MAVPYHEVERYKELISVSGLETGCFPTEHLSKFPCFDLKMEADLDPEKLWGCKLGDGQCAKCQP